MTVAAGQKGTAGIVRLHGYGSEHWRVEPDFAAPMSVRDKF